jgi:hypothetical protein
VSVAAGGGLGDVTAVHRRRAEHHRALEEPRMASDQGHGAVAETGREVWSRGDRP